jgi:hypothetical protein
MAAVITKIDLIKLREALSYKQGTPMSSIVATHDAGAFYSPKVYRFAPGIYMTFSDRMPRTAELNPDGLCLVSMLIAPDDSAVRRVTTKHDIEGDAGLILEPPEALLPKGATPSYGAILRGLEIKNGKGSLEAAVYRIASDGLFVFRKIETPDYVYFFRGREDSNGEVPFAIRHKFKK